MLHTASPTLPSHHRVLAELAAAERAEGWLARCADHDRYLSLTESFVSALSDALLALTARTPGPVLEVCAGDGSLAVALRDNGVAVIATDAHPSIGARHVERLTARAALDRYEPAVVLGAFVPYDSHVDRQVLDHPAVREYVVLNARLGGQLGASCLWTQSGWTRARLALVTTTMISRHDVWLGDDVPVCHYGEAWHLSRATARNQAANAAQKELDQ